MMKYLNILFYFLCFTFICGHDLCAQTFEIESQLSHSGSVGAANMPCDNNGNPCARIRIDLPIDNVSINGSYIVGEYGLNFDCYGPKYAKAGRYMLAKLANEGYQPAIETCSKKGINYENTRIKPEVNTSKDSYDISYSTNYGESLPHYPGGDIALFTEIDKILEHLGYTGEFGFVEFVEVEFVVSTDGKIINEHCNYYLFPTLNQEYSKLTTDVLRSLKKRFYPAKNRSGNEINCKVRLKIPVRI